MKLRWLKQEWAGDSFALLLQYSIDGGITWCNVDVIEEK